MKRIYLVAILIIATVLQIQAQDVIYLTNGDEVKAKVEEISETEIKYKQWDNQSGPMRSLAKTSVFMIMYNNGTRELFTTLEQKVQSTNNDNSTKPVQTSEPKETIDKGKNTGNLYVFEDGTSGVVFYSSGDGHGLVVSLDETVAKWQNEKHVKLCQDIYRIPNSAVFSTSEVSLKLGREYTNNILQQLGNAMAPAATWCIVHGDGWYLPSANELHQMLVVSNGCSASTGWLSKKLQTAGGQPIVEGWYWSSSEVNAKTAVNIKSDGKIEPEDKTDELRVRAVRAF